MFYLDKHHLPVIRLDRLPADSEGHRALLALYALENGAGCEGKTSSGKVRCALTYKLGLGANCSEQHISVVREWFDITPNLTSRWHEKFNLRAKQPGTLEELCYGQPDTASWQNVWEIIRMQYSGNRVEVESILFWGSAYGHGRVRYRHNFQIDKGRIVELSGERFVLSDSPESIFGGGK